jgi:hypothetical protein
LAIRRQAFRIENMMRCPGRAPIDDRSEPTPPNLFAGSLALDFALNQIDELLSTE